MKTLKETLDNYESDDFNHNCNPHIDEVMEKVNKDVKEAVLKFEKKIELVKDIYFSLYVCLKTEVKLIFGDFEK